MMKKRQMPACIEKNDVKKSYQAFELNSHKRR